MLTTTLKPPFLPKKLFKITDLFKSGEQGAWYDPSDINLAWRKNLLSYSEQFDNAYWTKNLVTISANQD
jgi:hypothetical protein